MGLGKTLSMIALIATDLKDYHHEDFAMHSSIDNDLSNETTLVIVPPPGTSLPTPLKYGFSNLLSSARQLGRAIITVSLVYCTLHQLLLGSERSSPNTNRHVVKSRLTWGYHHGKSRLTTISELDSYNLLLTTYHTVSAEWRNGSQAEKSILFSTRWKRVILDEGSVISHDGILNIH